MRTFCLRFDIDTPACLSEGVPRLLDLSESMGFRATFFLSMGRAISRVGALQRLATGSRARTPRAVGFSARQKLGTGGYLGLALMNPEIGRGRPNVVHRMARSAEVGLHGGRNHDTWQHGAHRWPLSRVETEVDWGLAWLKEMGIEVLGFSSPGWNEPAGLAGVLRARGFLYRADRHGPDMRGGVEEAPGFFNLATNLAGEPAGVAYVEHMRARGLSDAEIRSEFRRSLSRIETDVVLYDHPYYAGRRAVELLGDLVDIARGDGFEMATMAEMARRLAGSSAEGREGGPDR